MTTFHMSEKQYVILAALRKGNPDGSFMDLDQLHAVIPYKPSRQSLGLSTRILMGHGLVERKPKENRGGRMKRPLGLTEKGYAVLGLAGEGNSFGPEV